MSIKNKIIGGILAVAIFASVITPATLLAVSSGDRVAVGGVVTTITPNVMAKPSEISATNVYKVGDDGYAMCAHASKGSPASSMGTVYAVSSSTYSGTQDITATNAGTIGSYSYYRILQAAARAAASYSTVDPDVYLLLHAYASKIVSGDTSYNTYAKNASDDLALKTKVNTWIRTTDSSQPVYRWVPDNNDYQVLILGSFTVTTEANAKLSGQFHKVDGNGGNVSDVVFAAGSEAYVTNYGSLGRTYTSIVTGIYEAVGNTHTPGMRSWVQQCMTAGNFISANSVLCNMLGLLDGSPFKDTDGSHIMTEADVQWLASAMGGSAGNYWVDKTLSETVSGFTTAFYSDVLSNWEVVNSNGGSLYVTTDPDGTTGTFSLGSCKWVNHAITDSSALSGATVTKNGATLTTDTFYCEVSAPGYAVDTHFYKINVVFTENSDAVYKKYDMSNSGAAIGNPDGTAIASGGTVSLDNGDSVAFVNRALVPVTASVEFSFTKVNCNNQGVSGAKYTIYTDSACTNALTTLTTDSNGKASYEFGNVFGTKYNDDTELYTKRFYMKETKAPSGYVANNSVYTLTFKWTPSAGTLTYSAKNTTTSKTLASGTATRSGNTTSANISITGSYSPTGIYDDHTTTVDLSMRIIKVDQNGNKATGAVFVVKDGDTVVGSLDDSDGDGTYNMVLNSGYTIFPTANTGDTKTYSKTLTFSETEPANKVFLNGTWQARTFKRSTDTYSVTFTWQPSSGKVTWEVTKVSGTTRTVVSSGNTTRASNVWVTNALPTTSVTNRIVGSVRIHKVDTEGNFVSGCTFSISDDTGVLSTIDDSSIVEVDGVKYYQFTDLDADEDTTYVVNEVTAPEGFEIDPTSYSVVLTSENPLAVVNNATYTPIADYASSDSFVNRNPVVGTELTNPDTGDHITALGEEVTLTDVVSYNGLIPGKEYEMTGTLYMLNADTGNYLLDDDGNMIPLTDADGNVVTETTVFTPTAAEGTVTVTFTIDTTVLGGKSLVCWENCSRDGKLVGFHHGIEDQFVDTPSISTLLLSDDTDAHVAPQNTEITLTDTVMYQNLETGKEYTLSGVLMDLSTGEAFRGTDGAEITGSTTFTPTEKNGTVEVTFTFDSSLLGNQTLVAFETLMFDGTVIATHNDLSDFNQTVVIPDVHTTFHDTKFTEDDDIAVNGVTDLEDIVYFENLEVGRTYTVTGVVMVKSTNEPLKDADGNIVTASKTFTATESSGTVVVTFENVDTSSVGGDKLVAFETLETSGVTLVVHADIDDVDQTVSVPDAHTSFYDVAEGEDSDVASRGTNVTLTDIVSYDGFVAGKTYTVTGTVMVKPNDGSGAYVFTYANGFAVTASTTFTAESESGTVNVVFENIDTTNLGGKSLVAFETVIYEGRTIVIHADIEDVPQTVTVESPSPTPTPSPTQTPPDTVTKTGDQIGEEFYIGILLLFCGIGGGVGFWIKKRHDTGKK